MILPRPHIIPLITRCDSQIVESDTLRPQVTNLPCNCQRRLMMLSRPGIIPLVSRHESQIAQTRTLPLPITDLPVYP